MFVRKSTSTPATAAEGTWNVAALTPELGPSLVFATDHGPITLTGNGAGTGTLAGSLFAVCIEPSQILKLDRRRRRLTP